MIGSHLLDVLLQRGDYEVVGIDNYSFGRPENIAHTLTHPGFRFYRVDVTDFDTLKILCKDVEIVVHLAAVKKIAEKDSSLPTLLVNNRGTTNVLEAAKMWGAKVLFASTSDVYGMSEDLPHNEEGNLLLGPSMIRRWSYAVSKLFDEQLAFGYHQTYGVPVVVLRYFGGFSPRSSFAWSGGHIPIFIHAVLSDHEVVVHGDGSQTRSMAYVTDLVDGTVLAMENERAVGEVINLGNDEEMTVLEAARLIHRIAGTGRELRLQFVPFEEVFGKYKDIMRRVPDLKKARTLLGYSPSVRLEAAIAETIAEVRKAVR
jgi:UDP-glucose 4-epimerase